MSSPASRVDRGAFPLPGTRDEKITEGLDGLHHRLETYARTAPALPSGAASSPSPTRRPPATASAPMPMCWRAMAAACQAAGIVPVVEPEVLADGEPGDHSIERCQDVTQETLDTVFSDSASPASISRACSSNPTCHGRLSAPASGPSVVEVAERTVATIRATVPGGRPRHCLPLRRPDPTRNRPATSRP